MGDVFPLRDALCGQAAQDARPESAVGSEKSDREVRDGQRVMSAMIIGVNTFLPSASEQAAIEREHAERSEVPS